MAFRPLHSSFSPQQNGPTVRISCKKLGWPNISLQQGENGPFRRAARVSGARFGLRGVLGGSPAAVFLRFISGG
jgi:hypothetical protein